MILVSDKEKNFQPEIRRARKKFSPKSLFCRTKLTETFYVECHNEVLRKHLIIASRCHQSEERRRLEMKKGDLFWKNWLINFMKCSKLFLICRISFSFFCLAILITIYDFGFFLTYIVSLHKSSLFSVFWVRALFFTWVRKKTSSSSEVAIT